MSNFERFGFRRGAASPTESVMSRFFLMWNIRQIDQVRNWSDYLLPRRELSLFGFILEQSLLNRWTLACVPAPQLPRDHTFLFEQIKSFTFAYRVFLIGHRRISCCHCSGNRRVSIANTSASQEQIKGLFVSVHRCGQVQFLLKQIDFQRHQPSIFRIPVHVRWITTILRSILALTLFLSNETIFRAGYLLGRKVVVGHQILLDIPEIQSAARIQIGLAKKWNSVTYFGKRDFLSVLLVCSTQSLCSHCSSRRVLEWNPQRVCVHWYSMFCLAVVVLYRIKSNGWWWWSLKFQIIAITFERCRTLSHTPSWNRWLDMIHWNSYCSLRLRFEQTIAIVEMFPAMHNRVFSL